VRVLTINVFGGHPDWVRRREVLRLGVSELAPDLVALQEVVRTDAVDQVAELLGDGWRVVDHVGRGDDGVGASLASRWPIIATDRCRYEDSSLPWAGVVVAQLDAPDGPLLFVHHKPSWQPDAERARERETSSALRLVGDRLGDDVIVAGDLDAEPGAPSVRLWTSQARLVNTAADGDLEPTFSAANPLVADGDRADHADRRIDHVLVSAAFEVVRCERVFTEPVEGVWASDHFGVFAELIRRGPGGGDPG
jgi:endonuclease/exonuclease/phosphatase family metal-dependent hydrolase